MARTRLRRIVHVVIAATGLALITPAVIAADGTASGGPKPGAATQPNPSPKPRSKPQAKSQPQPQPKPSTGTAGPGTAPAGSEPSKANANAGAATAITSQCAALAGLAQQYCLQCEDKPRGDAALFFCKEKVRTIYCFKRAFKSDPECKNDFGSPNAN